MLVIEMSRIVAPKAGQVPQIKVGMVFAYVYGQVNQPENNNDVEGD